MGEETQSAQPVLSKKGCTTKALDKKEIEKTWGYAAKMELFLNQCE